MVPDSQKIKKQWNDLHVPKNYDDSPARAGINLSTYTEERVHLLQVERDDAIDIALDLTEKLENLKTELHHSEMKSNSWGKFQRAGYQLDLLIKMTIAIVVDIYSAVIKKIK
jgi:hypothetical protein